MLKRLLRYFLFDNKCSGCGKNLIDDSYLCSKCSQKLLDMGRLKERNGVYYLYYYQDVKKIIFDFKFGNRIELSKNLSVHIKKAINRIIEIESVETVIAVPISRDRFLERGYNQVDELLKKAGIKFEKIKRVKNTKHMYTIKNNKKRELNIKGAFEISSDYSGKIVLIVDDIITTGATLNEIKKELLEIQKAKKVIFFSLAIVSKYFK